VVIVKSKMQVALGEMSKMRAPSVYRCGCETVKSVSFLQLIADRS
jgi:hypothetical protein